MCYATALGKIAVVEPAPTGQRTGGYAAIMQARILKES
jgi:hypothetical protein